MEARAVRDLNNQVRHDLYLSLMDKSHAAYHSQDTGEYISWLTTNIKQMEHLAWGPFFSSILWTAVRQGRKGCPAIC